MEAIYYDHPQVSTRPLSPNPHSFVVFNLQGLVPILVSWFKFEGGTTWIFLEMYVRRVSRIANVYVLCYGCLLLIPLMRGALPYEISLTSSSPQISPFGSFRIQGRRDVFCFFWESGKHSKSFRNKDLSQMHWVVCVPNSTCEIRKYLLFFNEIQISMKWFC